MRHLARRAGDADPPADPIRRPRLQRHNGVPLALIGEDEAVYLWEALRWGDTGPTCPRCGSDDFWIIEHRRLNPATKQPYDRFLWRCYECKRARRHEQYTVRIGTPFSSSKMLSCHWNSVIYSAYQLEPRGGISARGIYHMGEVSYKVALRVRDNLADWGVPVCRKGQRAHFNPLALHSRFEPEVWRKTCETLRRVLMGEFGVVRS